MVAAGSWIYAAEVMHKRLRPARHRFAYKVFSFLLDLDELETLDRRLRLFSVGRFNLMGFLFKDHGARDGAPLKPWAISRFVEAGIPKPSQIKLLCFPRVFGYVFNPLSIYYGYDASGGLLGVIYEVKNTFGGQHCYVLPVQQGSARVEQSCDKAFYVSPFIDMRARYRFKLDPPGERLLVAILESTDDGPLLIATQTGHRLPLNDREILRCVAKNGWMTFKVMIGIHWEALWLWKKRVPLVPREMAPKTPAK